MSKRRIIDYKTVTNKTRDLDEAVHEFLEKGYEPYGYCFKLGTILCQVMVLRGTTVGTYIPVEGMGEAKDKRMQRIVLTDKSEEILFKKVDGYKESGWLLSGLSYVNPDGWHCQTMVKELKP